MNSQTWRTRRGHRSAIFAALLLATTTVLSAQQRISLGFAGGPVIPVGKTGDAFSTGGQGAVMVQYLRARSPLGGELGVSFARMGRKGGVVGSLESIALNADLLASFPTDPRSKSAFRVTLMGGVGGYYLRDELGNNHTNSYPVGLNGGGSIDLYMNPKRTASIFLDARYHYIFDDEAISMVPIVIGLKVRIG